MVLATGSRSSLFAVAATLLVLVALRPTFDRPLGPESATTVRVLALIGVLVGAVLPFMSFDATSFTGRVGLWELAKQQLAESPWVGLGGKAWSANLDSGLITADQAYAVHNQWLDVGYATGMLGVALFLILWIVAVRSGGSPTSALGLVILIPVIYLGVFERPITFTSLDVFTWIFPALFLALPVLARSATGGRLASAEPLHMSRPSPSVTR